MKKQQFLRGSIAIKLIFGLTLAIFCAAGYAQIEVRTAEDLNNVREDMAADYVQVADIDLEGINWNPLGGSRSPFTGTYDGRGHVIRNLTIERDGGDTGLFGGLNGTIRNLGIENANVTGGRNTGILLAYLVDGTVEQCYASGEVSGTHYVGGLIGFIGRGRAMNVLNSYAVGAVTSEDQAGGLAGDAHAGTITNCYAAVYLNGNPEHVGGLIGRETGNAEVRGSFWDTEVSTAPESAGGTGHPTESMTSSRTFSREWDMREIWDIEDGESYPFLRWQGDEPGDHNYPPDEGSPYGLVGVSGDEQISLSWEPPSAGEWVGYNVYRDGQRIAQTERDENEYNDQNVENYTEYSYYVTAVWEDQTESRPTNTVNVTPHLPFAGGDGSEEDPFQVATAQNLDDVRYNLNAHFIQTENINIGTPPWNTGEGWNPIGYWISHQENRPFRGSYDGDGNTISGLTIISEDGDYLGLFGYIQNAEITDLTLEEVTIVGNNDIGPLAARALEENSITNIHVTGEIEGRNSTSGLIAEFVGAADNCSFRGTVSGAGTIGGLFSEARGTIRNSHVEGNVTGTGGNVGGIAGQNRAETENCSFIGEVVGGNSTGGIAGRNSGEISRTYVIGSVTGTFNTGGISGQNTTPGEVHYCYADVEVTGYRTVGGITGSNGGAVIQPPPQVAISNSYVRGSVTASDEVDSRFLGGAVGTCNGGLTNVYSTASVTGPEGQIAGLVYTVRANNSTVNSYWDTEASGVDSSTRGTPRLTRQMIYPYDAETYIDWDFDEVWQDDPEALGNDGYPMLWWQDIPDLLDAPEVVISIITEEGIDYSVVSWQGVEGARSYKVFATDDISSDDWGDYITRTAETEFSEPVEEAGSRRFYKVVASPEDPEE